MIWKLSFYRFYDECREFAIKRTFLNLMRYVLVFHESASWTELLSVGAFDFFVLLLAYFFENVVVRGLKISGTWPRSPLNRFLTTSTNLRFTRSVIISSCSNKTLSASWVAFAPPKMELAESLSSASFLG